VLMYGSSVIFRSPVIVIVCICKFFSVCLSLLSGANRFRRFLSRHHFFPTIPSNGTINS
jgi:hypothetical protein